MIEYKFMPIGGSTEAGAIEGYGATFNSVDHYGDMIMPGAFAATLSAAAASPQWPTMLFEHGFDASIGRMPVGAWHELTEDDVGLRVKGRLAPTSTGDQLRALLQMEPRPGLNGLSIGFITREAQPGPGRNAGPDRIITRVDLLEVSLCSDPANTRARVDSVKSQIAAIGTMEWRGLERTLRDAGLSRNDAVKAVSEFRSWFQRDAGQQPTGHRDGGEAADIQAALARLALTIRR